MTAGIRKTPEIRNCFYCQKEYEVSFSTHSKWCSHDCKLKASKDANFYPNRFKTLEKARINHKNWRKDNPEEYMLQQSKSRARKLNLDFDLTRADIKIPDYCPVLNVPLKHSVGNGPSDNSPAIDRIDNNRGYLKDNIQIISQKANRMKNNASKEELALFANWIKENN